jgi:hypothetical protein
VDAALLVLALLLPMVLGGMDALYAHSTDLGHHCPDG